MRTLVLSLCLVLLTAPAGAAPKADLWQRWTAHDPASAAIVDHAAWDGFLARYRVMGEDGIARVAYGAVTPDDRAALDAYVDGLAAVPVSGLNRPEQRAYWVNLYNALTVRLVLDHYPVKSIRDIGALPSWLGGGPWKQKLVTVDGETLTLDDIEHRILRPIWRDPRIHYVVNCASLGCPDLPAHALTADNAEAVLDQAARAYVNHPRGVTVRDGRLTVSSIYVWFEADFGGGDTGVIAHLKRYAAPALGAQLETVDAIAGDAYDWSLNDR
jgi:hypothetical protein